MSTPQITPVASNREKQQTYREFMARYSRAMRNEFYLEALLIDYAVLEDRLRSFLYHMGMFIKRNDYKPNVNEVKRALASIVKEWKAKEENDQLGVNTITGKMKIIRCSAKWAALSEGVPDGGRYPVELKNKLQGLDLNRLTELLDEIKAWCGYRNEVIHSLLNKNNIRVDERLESMAQRGMELACEMGGFVAQLKKGNTLRNKLGLPVEKY